MTRLFAWIVGVSCVIAAFLVDWRAAGLMFVGAYLNNCLRPEQ